MAFLRYLLQRKQSKYLMTVLRVATVSFRHGYFKSFSTHPSLRREIGFTAAIDKPTIKTTANPAVINFENNDSVTSIAKQVKECVKGVLDQKDVINNYVKFKRTGKLSEDDFVRILVRLARSKDHSHKLDHESTEKFYQVLLEDIKQSRTNLKPFQIADVLWSLGKLGSLDAELFELFGSLFESIDDFSDFSNADMVMILWAHGKANIPSPIVFNLIQKEVLRRGVKNLMTRELCQIVWSFARVIKPSAKLFAAVKKTIQERAVTQFNNQDIIMLLWAFSEGGFNVKSLFRFIKMELLSSSRLAEYSPKDLSLILWSFANQGIKAEDLFAEVEKQLLTRRKLLLDEQSLVVVAWSFAHTDNKSPRLFKFIKEKLMVMNLFSWSLHRLVRILWAFTKSGFLCLEVLKKVTNAILKHDLSELSQNALEELVFTLQYGKLKVSPKLVSIVELELMKRAEERNR